MMRLTPLLRRGILDSPMIISLHSTDGNPDQSATCAIGSSPTRLVSGGGGGDRGFDGSVRD
ncbi:hypothetical protein TYRP_006533 [Tyrophagus putrescentiae]|nr:hypothetical protein TYRP_006533 [Tyrophagus putrescentiae]